MSKVWGFEVPCGPLIFNSRGRRASALRDLRQAGAGSRVILVATFGDEADEADRGRILGMMEPSWETVSSLDYPLPPDPRLRNANGDYKWPFGLVNVRAWQFPGKPEFARFTKRTFHMDAVTGIVPLTAGEAEAVLAERHHEVPLLRSISAERRLYGFRAARRRGAPPPSTTRRGIMHMREAPASTYLMQIQLPTGRVIGHKIGWAFDYEARQDEFNKVSLPGLGGLEYHTRAVEHWDTARKAFGMEQAILRHFATAAHSDNREVLRGVSYADVEAVWINYVASARRRPTATGIPTRAQAVRQPAA